MDFVFAQDDGSTSDEVLLKLGESGYGIFKRVAQGDGELDEGGQVTQSEVVSLEFDVPELFSPAGEQLTVSIQPAGALAAKSAALGFPFYDDSITLECLSGCQSHQLGGESTIVALTNFPLASDLSIFDQVSCTFGSFDALDLAFASVDDNFKCSEEGITCLRLTQPPCDACTFQDGALAVDLTVTMITDVTRGATSSFTFWSAPAMMHARINTVGTAVSVRFDQATDMASMTGKDSSCKSIVDEGTALLLAADIAETACIWEGADSLSIFLGKGATFSPGDILAIKPGVLKSINGVSQASSAAIELQGPEYPIKPVVSLMGTSAIDPCSELWLTALADSPRALSFKWSCSNDKTLDQKLSQVVGAELYLAEGTPEMTEQDKIYDISVVATDFLGMTSDTVVMSVLKVSSAAPKLTFDPPTNQLKKFREESVMVKVVAEFSKCPIEKGSLVFEWSLESRAFLMATGAKFTTDASVFETVGSQLLISGGKLDASAEYTLSVNAYMDNDPSKTTQGSFTFEIKKRDLVASIRGGKEISGSTTRDLVLDASDSADPDYTGGADIDPELNFAWSCTIVEAGILVPCRSKDGALLTLPGDPMVTLTPEDLENLYPTADYPYVFEVQVTKGQMTPQSFQMPVTLVETPIPAVSIGSPSGSRQSDGSILVSSQDLLVLYGTCSVGKGSEISLREWNFAPTIDESALMVIADESGVEVTSKYDTLLVDPGPD